MDLDRKVRLACAEGMSQRKAARHFNISCDSVRKMMAFPVPPGYRRKAAVRRPKLDAFTGIVDAWPDGVRDAHRKQRHTAKRAFERLRDVEPLSAIGPRTMARVQVPRRLESFGLGDLHAAMKKALQLGANGFDAIKHLVLCQVKKRQPKLDLDVYPDLPRANAATTSASSHMSLLSGDAA